MNKTTKQKLRRKGFEHRKMYFFQVILYLGMGSAYFFSISNFLVNSPIHIVLYNLTFAILFTGCLFLIKYNFSLTISISGILYQCFIFGHAYYLLPGKQIEAGFGLLTSILPIFLFDKKVEMWFYFVSCFILYHIVLFQVEYENVFYYKYLFYIVLFIMTYVITKENLEYEQELIVQRNKIQKTAADLEEIDALKTRFFANISHELRTPLTLILGPLEGIIKRNPFHSNQDYTTMLMMQQNANKLLKRINELLDLSTLDANKMKVETVPTFLYPFLKNIIISIDSVANEKDIQLQFKYHLSQDIQILLDTDKVEKIIYNYLSNAFKFTPQGGTITITAQRIDEHLQISVKDTGIGIPQEDIQKVFDRFYQSRSHTDVALQRLYTNGTGIGLALCQELAKVLNGKVWATSKIGKGSIFYVKIPLVETFAVKAKESILDVSSIKNSLFIHEPKSFNENQSTILIVEDNADLRYYISTILSDDYNIITAEHGKIGLEELANNQNIALIISDIMMPIMDGIEFLTNVKEHDEYRNIPVIMLTARQNVEIKLDALRIGVDDYITKPFNETELQIRVNNLIANSQSRIESQPLISENNNISTPKITANELKWLQEIEQIIIENIAQSNFMLTDIAEQVNLSYSGFKQKIKKITGLSPKKYERSIKLNRARTILKSGKVETVSEVLYQLGFENHYHFSKIYKEEFGIMPSEELK